jgi:hypothetical protein
MASPINGCDQIEFQNVRRPTAQTLPLIGGTTAGPAGSSRMRLQRLPAFVYGAFHLFCSAGGRKWPVAEMTVAGPGGRLLGYCGRNAYCWLQHSLHRSEGVQRLCALASGVEASSSIAVAMVGVAD